MKSTKIVALNCQKKVLCFILFKNISVKIISKSINKYSKNEQVKKRLQAGWMVFFKPGNPGACSISFSLVQISIRSARRSCRYRCPRQASSLFEQVQNIQFPYTQIHPIWNLFAAWFSDKKNKRDWKRRKIEKMPKNFIMMMPKRSKKKKECVFNSENKFQEFKIN